MPTLYTFMQAPHSTIKQCLNYQVWSHCFLAYAYKAPPFYPIEFEEAAAAVLGEMNMTYQDICVENANAIILAPMQHNVIISKKNNVNC